MKRLRTEKAKNFILIMVTIAILALFLRIAVKKTIEWNIQQDESAASSTIKLISTAIENYAKDHLGSYPSDISFLSNTNPPYLDKSYNLPFNLKGYIYSCSRLAQGGYSCWAVPSKCNLTGETIYNISTGGVLVAEKCSKGD